MRQYYLRHNDYSGFFLVDGPSPYKGSRIDIGDETPDKLASIVFGKVNSDRKSVLSVEETIEDEIFHILRKRFTGTKVSLEKKKIK